MIAPAVTPEQTKAALGILLAVSETIREVGEAPSGIIYAALMDRVDMQGYTKMLNVLKGAGLIVETPAHLLRWVGPLKGAK
jgi:hypothetical protein